MKHTLLFFIAAILIVPTSLNAESAIDEKINWLESTINEMEPISHTSGTKGDLLITLSNFTFNCEGTKCVHGHTYSWKKNGKEFIRGKSKVQFDLKHIGRTEIVLDGNYKVFLYTLCKQDLIATSYDQMTNSTAFFSADKVTAETMANAINQIIKQTTQNGDCNKLKDSLKN